MITNKEDKMEIKSFYEVNGIKFENKEDAENYLNECKAIDEKKKKLFEEKDVRKKEVNDAWDNYIILLWQYDKDYGITTINKTPFDWVW